MLESEKLKKIAEKYNINTFYLFGSRYDGTADQTSDIDLAYLKLSEEDDGDRDLLYFDLKEFIKQELDLVDLRGTKLTFAFHIIKNSRKIYDLSEEIRTDFEDRLIMKYLDFSFVNNLMNQEIMSNFLEG
jgi:predicted nucleotidyltransferase